MKRQGSSEAAGQQRHGESAAERSWRQKGAGGRKERAAERSGRQKEAGDASGEMTSGFVRGARGGARCCHLVGEEEHIDGAVTNLERRDVW